jgi:hypothetical protein
LTTIDTACEDACNHEDRIELTDDMVPNNKLTGGNKNDRHMGGSKNRTNRYRTVVLNRNNNYLTKAFIRQTELEY